MRPASYSRWRKRQSSPTRPEDSSFCDAVQLAGRADVSLASLGADALALSAHKMGGPKGAGALIASGPDVSLGEPLIRGGGQERGARAGTENVAAIAGFGAAARAAPVGIPAESSRLAALRDVLSNAVFAAAPDAIVFGATAPRLSNTHCFAVPSVEAATLMIALDLAGVAVSSGSACSSGKVDAVARAGGDGRGHGSGSWRDPIEPWVGLGRARCGAVRGGLRRGDPADAGRADPGRSMKHCGGACPAAQRAGGPSAVAPPAGPLLERVAGRKPVAQNLHQAR